MLKLEHMFQSHGHLNTESSVCRRFASTVVDIFVVRTNGYINLCDLSRFVLNILIKSNKLINMPVSSKYRINTATLIIIPT